MIAAGGLQISRATAEDLPFIVETERLPGYDRLVGRWDEQRHREALRDGRHAYFVARAGMQAVGFGIVRDWTSPDRVALVKRLAVSNPNLGHGRALLAGIARAVFEKTDTYRLVIGTFPDNLRARRAYEGAGFVAEGIARGSAFFHGEHRDELILALLRPDWTALTEKVDRAGQA